MDNERALMEIGRNLTRKYFGNSLAVGKYFLYEGNPIKITSGYFLDPTYGRVSNFWYWRKIFPDGRLSDEEYSGYGGDDSVFKPISEEDAFKYAKQPPAEDALEPSDKKASLQAEVVGEAEDVIG